VLRWCRRLGAVEFGEVRRGDFERHDVGFTVQNLETQRLIENTMKRWQRTTRKLREVEIE